MKKICFIIAFSLMIVANSYAQWTTSGSNINNTNSGNVGIGTTTPTSALDVGGLIQISSINNSTPPTGLNYGLFPYLGVGMGLFSGATGTNQGMGFWTNPGGVKTEVMRILSGGNVGIGTTNPINLLTLNSSSPSMLLQVNGSNIAAFSANGTSSTWNGGSGIGLNLAVANADISMVTGIPGATAMIVKNNGNVGIGTITPGTYKLAVNGTIHTKEVLVDLNGWSDFVFNKDFRLMPLSEVKSFINKNHHLPDLPSEKEVLADGLKLGEINKLLTKKVEELTLYIIQQQKIIEQLEEKQETNNKSIEERLKKLEKQGY